MDRILEAGDAPQPRKAVQERLLAAAPDDIEQLRPHLEPRAEKLAGKAQRLLRSAASGRRASCGPPWRCRGTDAIKQSWRRWLEQFGRDIETEPGRIRDFCRVRAERVEPVGLVYLWPETGRRA